MEHKLFFATQIFYFHKILFTWQKRLNDIKWLRGPEPGWQNLQTATWHVIRARHIRQLMRCYKAHSPFYLAAASPDSNNNNVWLDYTFETEIYCFYSLCSNFNPPHHLYHVTAWLKCRISPSIARKTSFTNGLRKLGRLIIKIAIDKIWLFKQKRN